MNIPLYEHNSSYKWHHSAVEFKTGLHCTELSIKRTLIPNL